VRANTRTWQPPHRGPARSIRAVPRPRLLLLLSVFIVLGAAAPAGAATTVRQASGPNPAAIQAAIDQFRADLGTNNGGDDPAQSGRREISWDELPDIEADPNKLPPDAYAGRGALLSTPGTGLQVSADSSNPDGRPIEFGRATLFAPFSPQRLFSPLGSTITDVRFVEPGGSTPALSRGFGAVLEKENNKRKKGKTYYEHKNKMSFQQNIKKSNL